MGIYDDPSKRVDWAKLSETTASDNSAKSDMTFPEPADGKSAPSCGFDSGMDVIFVKTGTTKQT